MRLEELENEEKPYAVFRMPKSDEIILYLQNNPAVNSTHDFDEKGFVLAPFFGGENVFISADNIYTFPIKDKESTISNASVTLPDNEEEKHHFKASILRAKKDIKKGDLEKVVLSRSLCIESKKSAVSVFDQLVKMYPNAFVYCWHHPKVGEWVGATPERFVSLDSKHLKTMSLAGTLPYTAEEPRWTAKELHEQNLVTKSIVADLNRAFPALTPDIGVTENLRAGALYHLRTQITLPSNGLELKTAVNALHPTPAVGGLPKKSALDFILKNELHDREYYTGFLGPFSSKNKADLFVNLRCAKKTAQGYTVYVGAGITLDSDPEKEYLETQRKAQTMGISLLF